MVVSALDCRSEGWWFKAWSRPSCCNFIPYCPSPPRCINRYRRQNARGGEGQSGEGGGGEGGGGEGGGGEGGGGRGKGKGGGEGEGGGGRGRGRGGRGEGGLAMD